MENNDSEEYVSVEETWVEAALVYFPVAGKRHSDESN